MSSSVISDPTQKGKRTVALLTFELIVPMQIHMITIGAHGRVNFEALSTSEDCAMFGTMVTILVSNV